MNGYLNDTFNLILTFVLIILNGFFVAAEFALVKVNTSKIKAMQRNRNPFANVALWLYKRQNMALSACQMGITMASLALGWIGEPALAHLIRPVLEGMGLTSEALIHGVAFTIAFSIITSLHIVVGEQFPKIYAIRQPSQIVGWTAYPLKFFYIIFFPFMWMLDRVTAKMLNMVGIDDVDGHDSALSEEEIRASLSLAYNQGDLTKNEHALLNAAFRFDDQITRQIMLPRNEVIIFDKNLSNEENLQIAKATRHTRFPLCNGSLDEITGVVHIKDLVGLVLEDGHELEKLSRKPVFVPETLPIHQLLMQFRTTKQHMAFVENEFGTVTGIVTLENLVEQLIGNVQDEFDSEEPHFIKEAENVFLINGNLSLNEINERFHLNLSAEEADTISGLLMEQNDHQLLKGKKIMLPGNIEAEVLNLNNRTANKVRLTIPFSEE
jgi:CBS domain containing-hemolysin-like protein